MLNVIVLVVTIRIAIHVYKAAMHEVHTYISYIAATARLYTYILIL